MTGEQEPIDLTSKRSTSEIIGNLCESCQIRCQAIDNCHGNPIELRMELEDPWYFGCPVNDATLPQIQQAHEAQGLVMRVVDQDLLEILKRSRNIHEFWEGVQEFAEEQNVDAPPTPGEQVPRNPRLRSVLPSRTIDSTEEQPSHHNPKEPLAYDKIEEIIKQADVDLDLSLKAFGKDNNITPYALIKLIKIILRVRFKFAVLDHALKDPWRREIENAYDDLFPIQPWNVGDRERDIRERCELYVEIVVRAWLTEANGEEVVQPMPDQVESTDQLVEAGSSLDMPTGVASSNVEPVQSLARINSHVPKPLPLPDSVPTERMKSSVREAFTQDQIRKIFSRALVKPSKVRFGSEWNISDDELLAIIFRIVAFRFKHSFIRDHKSRDLYSSDLTEFNSTVFDQFNLSGTDDRSIAIRGRCLVYVKIVMQEWLQEYSEENNRAADFKTKYPMFEDVSDVDELFEVYIEEIEGFAELLEKAGIRSIQFNELRDKLIRVRSRFPLGELSSGQRQTLRNELNKVYVNLGVSDELLDKLIPHFNFLLEAVVQLNLVD